MGILDEAIREHLALKRRQGLSEDEIKRLEDEAFGPPARPGEPDFPDREDREADQHAERAPEDRGDGDEPRSEPAPGPESKKHGAPGTDRPDAEAPSAFYDFAGEEGAQPPETAASGAGIGADPSSPPADSVRERPETTGASEPSERSGEPQGKVEEPSSTELDLGDLDLDDEPAADAGEAEEASAPQVGAEAPVEAHETVEHPMHEEVGESPSDEHPLERSQSEGETFEPPSDEYAVEEPPSDEYAVEEPPSDEYAVEEPPSDELSLEPESGEHEVEAPGEQAAGDDRPGGDETREEDVLEETPDFLRDAPEDDELWFEQGEPKDFDF